MAGGSGENENVTNVIDGDVRLSKLRSALDKTAKACVSDFNSDLFTTHFNPNSRDEKKLLRSAHLNFKEKAFALMKDEIILMIREENVEQMLSKLDELCKLSSHGEEELWRPKGVPVDDVTAHLSPVLLDLRKKLKSLLRDVETETDQMMRSVNERRRLVHSLKTEIAQNVKLMCQDAAEINVLPQDC